MTRVVQVVVLLGFLMGVVNSAFAKDVSAYLAAGEEFDRRVAELSANHEMPRASDEAVAGLLATLSDSERFLDAVEFQLSDMEDLMAVCGKANAITMSYILFDLRSHVNSKSEPKDVALQAAKLMNNNVFKYQQELQLLQPFQNKCMAKQIPLLEEFSSSLKPEEITPIRRAGLQKMRQGVFQVFYGTLAGINNSELSESYRTRVLHALAVNASVYASVLPPIARQQIFDLAFALDEKASSKYHADLSAIVTAMNDDQCKGLCAY